MEPAARTVTVIDGRGDANAGVDNGGGGDADGGGGDGDGGNRS